jgi:hypothetical protein
MGRQGRFGCFALPRELASGFKSGWFASLIFTKSLLRLALLHFCTA